MPSVTLGNDGETGKDVRIGDIERRSGLYILGKPGMGKSALLVNIALQDIEHHHGVFFLDPHGEAIVDIIKRGSFARFYEYGRILDPATEKHTFGINLLSCTDITSLTERTETYTRAYNVFYKLWEDSWGPWLQLILQNTLWAFIENPQYTLAEVPMFLNPYNTTFRHHIIDNIKYNPACVDFWKYEFFARRERDQQERVDAARTRIITLLTHPYVGHILGQRKTTIDFADILAAQKIIFVKLSANLPEDIKKFIGTILISELLHAVRNRPENNRKQFCIFVDEFQNFASADDFRTLITEGRKFGVTTIFAHQERFGQFADNQKLMGATLAAVNKVFFQTTVIDSKELAPEFAKKPTSTETRLEPELVIVKEPLSDLFKRDHANPRIRELVRCYFQPLQDDLNKMEEQIGMSRLLRTGLQDQATLYRDYVSLSRIDEQRERNFAAMARGRDIAVSHDALNKTETLTQRVLNTNNLVQEQSKELIYIFHRITTLRQRIQNMNWFLVALMEGQILLRPGIESLAHFIHDVIGNNYVAIQNRSILSLYVDLVFGDSEKPRSIPAILAVKYWRGELEQTFLNQRDKNEYHKKRFMEHHLAAFRERPIILENGLPVIRDAGPSRKHNWTFESPYILPNLPPRRFTESEREKIKTICFNELLPTDPSPLLSDLIEFCTLFTKPENHIKTPSGQYVEKQGHVRQVHDMTDEMAQELANLPRFIAYAKVIDESEGFQRVLKKKIQTIPMQHLPGNDEAHYGQLYGFLWNITLRSDLLQEAHRNRSRNPGASGEVADSYTPDTKHE